MARILIAGCGYVGTALGVRLVTTGHTVWGLCRRTDALPQGIHPLAADLTTPQTLRGLPPGLEYVFYTAAPDGSSDAAYSAAYGDGLRTLLDTLTGQRQPIQRFFLTSSTAVYGQSAGEWVDETSPTAPTHFTGLRLLEGERLLLRGPFPATVLRLGGIYGPGRTRLIERMRQGAAVCQKGPPVYINRIHRDDSAGALQHLMGLPQPDSLYLGVDHEPADLCTVLRWLAAQLGAPPPRSEAAPDPDRQRRRSNKRASNARLVASGYRFRYPGFREGYAALLAAGGA